MAGGLAEGEDAFTLEQVRDLVRKTPANRASDRLPRQAVKTGGEATLLATWATANLAIAMGRPASLWRRLVTPVDKTGTGAARKETEVRPVSFVDEMESLVDALWLQGEQEKLQQYAGHEQGGGRYDSLLMTLGIVITLQARKEYGLPSWLVAADLLHGYDLGWRDGLRIAVDRAGLRGAHGFIWTLRLLTSGW